MASRVTMSLPALSRSASRIRSTLRRMIPVVGSTQMVRFTTCVRTRGTEGSVDPTSTPGACTVPIGVGEAACWNFIAFMPPTSSGPMKDMSAGASSVRSK